MPTDALENVPAISAEFRLLVALTRAPEDPGIAAAFRSCQPIDWDAFVALAEFHRVEGLIAASLAAHRSAPVPPQVRKHFAQRLKSCSLTALASAKATIEITRSLAQRDIPSVLLKGAAVANRFYTSPCARQSIDIDLLVPEHMVAAALAAIEDLGFAQTHPTAAIPATCHGTLQAIANDVSLIRPSDGVKLELHWRLSRNPYFARWRFVELHDNAATIELGGTPIAVLDPATLLAYLACHGARHAWFRLKWLADIDRMLGRMTPEQISKTVDQSAQDGTPHLLATCLHLHQLLYGSTHAAANELAAYADPRLLGAFLHAVLASRPHRDVRLGNFWTVFRDLRFGLSLRREPAYKVSAILGLLTDVRDIATLRLSKRWLWVYALAGPVLAAGRIARRELARSIHQHAAVTEADQPTGQEKRAMHSGSMNNRFDAACRPSWPAHRAGGASST